MMTIQKGIHCIKDQKWRIKCRCEGPNKSFSYLLKCPSTSNSLSAVIFRCWLQVCALTPPERPGAAALTSDTGAFTERANSRTDTMRAPAHTRPIQNFKLSFGAAVEHKQYNVKWVVFITVCSFELLAGFGCFWIEIISFNQIFVLHSG